MTEIKIVNVLPSEGFVDVKQILGDKRKNLPGVLPISASSWHAGKKTGKYPKGIKHGDRTFYPVHKIRELLDKINNESAEA